jgi:hypothetical protein
MASAKSVIMQAVNKITRPAGAERITAGALEVDEIR